MKNIADVRQENLRLIIKEQFRGSQSAFAEHMAWSERSLVSRLLSSKPGTRQNIGNAMARSIELKCGKPENWLDYDRAQRVLDQERGPYNVIPGPEVRHSVPLISWVQAGQWGQVVDNLRPGEAESWVSTTARVSPRAYALRVQGDSMTNPAGSPSFPDGTVIILDPERPADPGKFVIVRQRGDEECTFKQLVRDGGRFYLKPLNPRYPILEMEADAVICGVLVQAVMDFS